MTTAADSSATPRRSFGFHAPEEPLPGVKHDFPGVVYTRPFISGVLAGPAQHDLIKKASNACAESWREDMVPVYSFKLAPDEVAAGKWDRAVRELAEWHLDQPAAMLVLWHEPEGRKSGFRNGAEYARYFNRLAGEIRKRNTALPLVYAALGYQWGLKRDGGGSIGGRTDTPAGWNAVEADLRCCDVYSGIDENVEPLERSLADHPGFQRWLDLIAPRGPYGLTERGFTLKHRPNDSAVRVAAIDRDAAWLRDTADGQRCSMYLYWSSLGAENDTYMPVDGPARKAVGRLFAAFRSTPAPATA